MLPFLVYVEVGGGSQHQSALITSVRETKMDSLVMVVERAFPHTEEGAQLTLELLSFMLSSDMIPKTLFRLTDVFTLLTREPSVAVLDVHVLTQGSPASHVVAPWFGAGLLVVGVQSVHVFVEGGLGRSPEITIVAGKLLDSFVDEPNVLIYVMFACSTITTLPTLKPLLLVFRLQVRGK